MSNPNPEPVLDEPDAVRSSQQPVHPTGTGTKKKSGFVITSVTDSGHGRPASIVRDGEESADDLDESHTSYSDMSYSRTTDADHDQESTASEDTLNISAHESASLSIADGPGLANHVGVAPLIHPSQPQNNQLHPVDIGITTNKLNSSEPQHSSHQTITNSHISTNSHGGTLVKQLSEHLESPQELPHDNPINDIGNNDIVIDKEKQMNHNSSSSASVDTVVKGPTIKNNSSGQEQNHDQSNTVSASNVPPTSLQLVTPSASTDQPSTTSTERPTVLNTTATTGAPSSKTPSVGTAPPSSTAKVSGTRVYKVVKRDTHQPSKRVRGRWSFYDFSDNQAATVGMISHSASDSKLSQDFPFIPAVGQPVPPLSANVGPFSLQSSDSSSSILKEQLLRTGFPPTNPFTAASALLWEAEMKKQYDEIASRSMKAEDRDVSLMAPDALKSAMKYAARANCDPTTGDMSSTSRSLKIDNKIEAAMDLVKKHLMSAVRDEVDELKEKIKELQEENVRIKGENQVLRCALPADVLQNQLPPRRDASAKDKKMNAENQPPGSYVSSGSSNDSLHQQMAQSNASSEHSAQKGHNPTKIQPSTTNDNKVKVTSTTVTSNTGVAQPPRQDPSKILKANPAMTQAPHQPQMTLPSSSNHHPMQGTAKISVLTSQAQKPAAGLPVKPAAGQPVKPAAGQPVKPAAGQPAKPAASQAQKPGHLQHNDHQRSDSANLGQQENPPTMKSAQTSQKSTEINFVKKNTS